MSHSIDIVPATEADFPAIWTMFRQVIEEGETYSYGPETTEAWAKDYWINPQVYTFVAKIDGEIAGCYALRTNRAGNGAHVANASYMVNEKFRGRGIGRLLGEHSLAEAKRRGYLAMVFNFVVSTNERAVKLWKSLGFNVVGTLPKGFRSKRHGLVDALIMHQFL